MPAVTVITDLPTDSALTVPPLIDTTVLVAVAVQVGSVAVSGTGFTVIVEVPPTSSVIDTGETSMPVSSTSPGSGLGLGSGSGSVVPGSVVPPVPVPVPSPVPVPVPSPVPVPVPAPSPVSAPVPDVVLSVAFSTTVPFPSSARPARQGVSASVRASSSENKRESFNCFIAPSFFILYWFSAKAE